jgi:hypothetical protein
MFLAIILKTITGVIYHIYIYMYMYRQIVNPITGRKVNINGNLGTEIIRNYLNQIGGHDGPCGLNSTTRRCKKSASWDRENCEIKNGRCKNIKNPKKKLTKINKQKKLVTQQKEVKTKKVKREIVKKESKTTVNLNCNDFATNKGKKCPNCCSQHYDKCKWVSRQPKGKGCQNKESLVVRTEKKTKPKKIKEVEEDLPVTTNITRIEYPELSRREINEVVASIERYIQYHSGYGGHYLSRQKKKERKNRYLENKNTKKTMERCQTHKLPKMPKLRGNYKMVSIAGPVGLDYIQFKNTEIFLFPEKHQFGVDEDRIKRVKYDKYHIPIVEVYQAITDSNLCVDIYHEDLRFRQKILEGGKELKYQNMEDARGKYASYTSIIDNYGYGKYAYNWGAKPENLRNTFFHYGEFRTSISSNFAIWDLLQKIDSWSGRINPALENTGLTLNALNTLRLNYLSTPRIIAKLAEAYCLRDDFETAIREIFPDKICELLFDFNALKYYNNNWMHPIRKEIAECPHKTKLERFIKRHIDGIKNKNTFADSSHWYFEQPGRTRSIRRYLSNLGENINLTSFFNSLYIDNKTKKILKQTRFAATHTSILFETALYLGDFLTDLYDLSRLLRYIEERNTNIVLYYGGWAHPWTVRKYFLEEFKNSRDIKVHKSYGRFNLGNNFWSDDWEDQNRKINRESYSFEMPYTDFKTLFVRKNSNGSTLMDITQNNLTTSYNNPRSRESGDTMSGDWDLYSLVDEGQLTYSKNDLNKGFIKID